MHGGSNGQPCHTMKLPDQIREKYTALHQRGGSEVLFIFEGESFRRASELKSTLES